MRKFFHNNQRLLTDAFGITLMTFVLMLVVQLGYRFLRAAFVDKFNLVSGVTHELEAEYANFTNARVFAQPVLSPKLPILVDIDTASRPRIAVVLDSIARRHPRVVGLDVAFAKAGTRIDTNLRRVLHQLAGQGKLVQAYTDVSRIESIPMRVSRQSADNNPGQEGIPGYIDFSLHTPQPIIRQFTPWLAGDTAFAGRLVALYDPASWQRFKNYRHHSEPDADERILYQPGDVQADTLHESDFRAGNPRLANLQNALVIVGSLAGYRDVYLNEDIHPVPIGSGSLSGLEIHAHIVAMLLNNSYPRRVSPLLLFILSFLLCWALVSFFLTRYTHPKHHFWSHLIFKVTQIGLAIFILGTAGVLFNVGNIHIDPLVFLIPVGLSVEVIYMYEQFALWLHNRVNHPPNNEQTTCKCLHWLTKRIHYHTYFRVSYDH